MLDKEILFTGTSTETTGIFFGVIVTLAVAVGDAVLAATVAVMDASHLSTVVVRL